MNDWLERELEDYIVTNPYAFTNKALLYPRYEISVLGRQVRCQYGIIDVLMWARNVHESFVLVVECKAKHEKGLAVEQVLRYKRAVTHAGMYDDTPPDAWPTPDGKEQGWARYIEIQAIPVIVAPSFNSQFATTYSGILVTANKVGADFEFARMDGEYPDKQDQLDAVLRPMLKRAHIDAKTKELQSKLTGIPDYIGIYRN